MRTADKVRKVAIVGNGLMGQGIAQVFARKGREVAIIGRNAESLGRARKAIEANVAAFVERGLTSRADADAALARISTGTDYAAAADADHAIEAVPNVLETQVEVFARLDEACPADVVLGSTSGQPISRMTGGMRHPGRAVAMHFIYPAQLMPLVEVCGGPETAPEAVEIACAILKSVGQTPAVMNKEVPGFIVNRLQFAVIREAWSMWANGIASAEAIDNSFKMTLGRRYSITGPIESAELGGLDVLHGFAQFLFPEIDDAKQPPQAVTDLVDAGHHGFKTGRGIYDWSKRDGKALLAARADRLFRHMAED